jgi:tRNA1Val (adenine37-N6)-methyltransferase
MTFRFKNFAVEDELSTMRIGTDAILLGSWINTVKAEKILDIGTGCGVIALMMAQKSHASVDAIDIDPESIGQARLNFRNSPWNDRLTAWHRSFSEHAENKAIKYDIILSNPPYFRNSLKSPEPRKNLARHHGSPGFAGLFEAVNILLSENGSFYIILPETNMKWVMELAMIHRLPVNHILKIKPKDDKKANRVMMKFRRTTPENITVEELVIRHKDNTFTDQYKELTADFYLGLP